MGQTLSEPVTQKESYSQSNHYVKVGSSCMQGWRVTMEDAHTEILSLPGDSNACFFAVYDGHGGSKIAQHVGQNLHKKVVQRDEYGQGLYEVALKKSFLSLDEDMKADPILKDEMSGTTAIACLIRNSKVYCANVGDSRAVMSVRGMADALSCDHKPNNHAEMERILAAGGWVEFNRVNGNLALSRALGDFIFKQNDGLSAEKQMVTAEPDITVKNLTSESEFIIMACDGIWDVLTNQEVVDFVRARVAQRMEPEIICEELMMRCLAPDCQMGGLGCDNMTVILVCFLHGSTYADLASRCSHPKARTTLNNQYFPRLPLGHGGVGGPGGSMTGASGSML